MDRDLRDKLEGGKFKDVATVDAKRMSAVRGKGNKTTEQRFRALLVRAGIRGWMLNPKKLVGNPDVVFPEGRVAVFLDGCFWHGCPTCGHVPSKNGDFWRAKIARNQERDIRQADALVAVGYRVIRFWEHEIQSSGAECISRLRIVLLPQEAQP